jgi:type IV conjugative transfer system protein TraE
MDKNIHLHNLSNILKQRNLFLALSLGLLCGNIILSLKILLQSERIILTPGLKQKVWLSRNMVSNSYLEEMTNIYLSNLLDINMKNIAYKKSLIMSNLSTKDVASLKSITEYFTKSEDKYKRFDLTTYFTVKKIEIDIDKLQTTATGILTSSYGKKGISVNEEQYLLSFDYHNGTLLLQSFTRIIE